MFCRLGLCFGLVLSLWGCSGKFCTRHSDCPPTTECGAAGVCQSPIAPASDADLTLPDASRALSDAMNSQSDGMSEGPDAMASADGGAMLLDAGLSPPVDAGGAELLDSGLSPPADAMATVDGGAAVLDSGLSPPADGGPDAGSPFEVVFPELPGGQVSDPSSGSGGMAEELDAGLAP